MSKEKRRRRQPCRRGITLFGGKPRSAGFASHLPLARLLLVGLSLVAPASLYSQVTQQPNPPPPPTLLISSPQPNAQVFSPVQAGFSCSCNLVGPLTVSVDRVADTTDQILVVNDIPGFTASGKLTIQQAGTHTLTAVANVGCPNPLNPGNPTKYLISASVTFTVLVHTYAFSYDEMGNLKAVAEVTPPPHPSPPPKPPSPRGGGNIALITFAVLLAVWNLKRMRRHRREHSLRASGHPGVD